MPPFSGYDKSLSDEELVDSYFIFILLFIYLILNASFSGYDKSLSDEELDNLMQKPAAVFTQDLLQETNLAKQTLTELRERHDQFLKLEGNIVELNQLFVVRMS